MNTSKREDYVGNFLQEINAEKCPVLIGWFKSKLDEIMELPIKPDRKGIPKGDPMPIPRYKMLLALCRLVNPYLKLKDFAEAYDASYGTVRVWASRKIEEGLRHDFGTYYRKHLTKLLYSEFSDDEPEDAKIAALIQSYLEPFRYTNALFLPVTSNAKEDVIRDFEKEVESADMAEKIILTRRLSISYILSSVELLKDNEKQLKDTIDLYLASLEKEIGLSLDTISESIDKDDKISAKFRLSLLKDWIINDAFIVLREIINVAV